MKIKQRMNEGLVIKELQQFIEKQKYSSVFVLTDENTHQFCYPLIRDVFGIHTEISILSGEAFKNLETCEFIWEKLSMGNADRNSLLVNLGGGVICDMGGFAASVYKRGIDFIHIPTTLLAMSDSCIGGKTGTNLENIKNVIGTFSDAEAVFIYPEFLKTLPEKFILSGFAEMLKHAIIKGEKHFKPFELLTAMPENFEEIIFESLKIKLEIVEKDPYEKGIRKKLNFGHTIGHALETYFLDNYPDNYLSHGEAIAIGMLVESRIAMDKKLLSKPDYIRIEKCIKTFFTLPVIDADEIESIAALCMHDKKNNKGKILFALPTSIGTIAFDISVPVSTIKLALKKTLVQ